MKRAADGFRAATPGGHVQVAEGDLVVSHILGRGVHAVPAGRTVVRELRNTDQVASIIHNSGEPVTVLIEYQGV